MADTPQDDGNHRVTLAEIKRDIAHLIAEVQDGREETKRWRDKIDQRVRILEEHCATNTTDIARLDERQKATTGILGGMTLIGSIIAGAVGSLVK